MAWASAWANLRDRWTSFHLRRDREEIGRGGKVIEREQTATFTTADGDTLHGKLRTDERTGLTTFKPDMATRKAFGIKAREISEKELVETMGKGWSGETHGRSLDSQDDRTQAHEEGEAPHRRDRLRMAEQRWYGAGGNRTGAHAQGGEPEHTTNDRDTPLVRAPHTTNDSEKALVQAAHTSNDSDRKTDHVGVGGIAAQSTQKYINEKTESLRLEQAEAKKRQAEWQQANSRHSHEKSPAPAGDGGGVNLMELVSVANGGGAPEPYVQRNAGVDDAAGMTVVSQGDGTVRMQWLPWAADVATGDTPGNDYDNPAPADPGDNHLPVGGQGGGFIPVGGSGGDIPVGGPGG